jgi:hypothetical protein
MFASRPYLPAFKPLTSVCATIVHPLHVIMQRPGDRARERRMRGGGFLASRARFQFSITMLLLEAPAVMTCWPSAGKDAAVLADALTIEKKIGSAHRYPRRVVALKGSGLFRGIFDE